MDTVALYMDTPPLFGGYTYFQNIPRLALELASDDVEAFRSLFLPDALTIIRPRGRGAIKVTTPVLFLDEHGGPRSFFRVASGEYQVSWRADTPALLRAAAFLNRYAEPFSAGGAFLHFTGAGHGCFINNRVIAHGRTQFVDGSLPSEKRVVSRKWFMASGRDAIYKHIPGMFVLKRYANLFPELFGVDRLLGEWNYCADEHANIRIR